MFLKSLKNRFLQYKKEKIKKDFEPIVQRAEEDFGDHQGVTRYKIIRWISQFPTRSKKLSAKVLQTIRYYSSSNISIMTRQLVSIVFNVYADIDKRDIFFVPIGNPGSGSQIVARHMKITRQVPNDNIIDLLTLHRISKQRKIPVIVFIDDFSGSGKTISDWWKGNETLILPLGAQVGLGLLVLNHKAKSTLQKAISDIMPLHELEEKENVFDKSCEKFTDTEKNQLLKLCKKCGCNDRFVKGWQECGLLIAFSHGCPNNSLPILWYQSERWENLFQRRAV